MIYDVILKQDLYSLLQEIEIKTPCLFSALIRELPCQLLIIESVYPLRCKSELLQISTINYKNF